MQDSLLQIFPFKMNQILRTLLPILLTQALVGATNGQLLAKDVSEGECISQAELLPHLYKGANTAAVSYVYLFE